MKRIIFGLSLFLNGALLLALKISHERNQAFRQQIIMTDKHNERVNQRGNDNAY